MTKAWRMGHNGYAILVYAVYQYICCVVKLLYMLPCLILNLHTGNWSKNLFMPLCVSMYCTCWVKRHLGQPKQFFGLLSSQDLQKILGMSERMPGVPKEVLLWFQRAMGHWVTKETNRSLPKELLRGRCHV